MPTPDVNAAWFRSNGIGSVYACPDCGCEISRPIGDEAHKFPTEQQRQCARCGRVGLFVEVAL